MVGGQILDMESEERACTEQEILDIQSRKTGALIQAACRLGVLAGGGNEEQLQAAGSFAAQLGLAFQIRDDMLDRIGDARTLGKAVGVDGKKIRLSVYTAWRSAKLWWRSIPMQRWMHSGRSRRGSGWSSWRFP